MNAVGSMSGDGELRRIITEVKQHMRSSSFGSSELPRLSMVVWELLTNIVHVAGLPVSPQIVVEVERHRIVVRIPGAAFDSVVAATRPNARGLYKASRLLHLCYWKWSHRHADDVNEIHLERKRP